MAPTLTVGQTEQFVDRGYLSGMEVFDASEMSALRAGYAALCGLLEPGESPGAIREWHMASRWLYDVCSAPALLDLVEGVLGPDFYMWGSQFFSKSPRSSSTVAWHQDGYYWPLEPLHQLGHRLAGLRRRGREQRCHAGHPRLPPLRPSPAP